MSIIQSDINFPLNCRQEIIKQIQDMEEIYNTISSEKDLWYFSTPITTGPKYYEWLEYREKDKHHNEQNTTYQNVIDYNKKYADITVNSLIYNHDAIVINPAKLDIKGWFTEDYLLFWSKIIGKCNKVIFARNWTKSKGCIYEYYIAKKLNKQCLTEDMFYIDHNDSLFLIKNFLLLLKRKNLRNNFIQDLYNELIKL